MSRARTLGATTTLIADDVLVNRRRGRFSLLLGSDRLVLSRDEQCEDIDLESIGQVTSTITDRRVRLRFHTIDGSTWTIRWFDAPGCRTSMLLELLNGR